MHPYLRLLKNNAGRGSFRSEGSTLWLYDVIASSREEAAWFGGMAPEDFVDALRGMSGPVSLRINSPGGSVFGAQAMAAAMREYEGKITARVDALAASAASVIAAEAAEVEIAQGAMVMIHRAWGVAMGNAEDMTATAALLDKIDGQIAGTYGRRAGEDKDWRGMMAAETWFDADEAVAIGLADRVLTDSTQRDGAWDLSAFKAAPWQPAPEPVADVVASETPEDTTGSDAEQERARRQMLLRVKGI